MQYHPAISGRFKKNKHTSQLLLLPAIALSAKSSRTLMTLMMLISADLIIIIICENPYNPRHLRACI